MYRFMVKWETEPAQSYTLAEMLAANADDADVSDFLKSAQVGDSSIFGGGAAPVVLVERAS